MLGALPVYLIYSSQTRAGAKPSGGDIAGMRTGEASNWISFSPLRLAHQARFLSPRHEPRDDMFRHKGHRTRTLEHYRKQQALRRRRAPPPPPPLEHYLLLLLLLPLPLVSPKPSLDV